MAAASPDTDSDSTCSRVWFKDNNGTWCYRHVRMKGIVRLQPSSDGTQLLAVSNAKRSEPVRIIASSTAGITWNDSMAQAANVSYHTFNDVSAAADLSSLFITSSGWEFTNACDAGSVQFSAAGSAGPWTLTQDRLPGINRRASAVAVSSNGTAVLVGVASAGGNTCPTMQVYLSTDGGATFSPSLILSGSSSARPMRMVWCGDSGVAVLATNRGAWISTDGGHTFYLRAMPRFSVAACSADASVIVIGGYGYDNYPTYLLMSRDHGITWAATGPKAMIKGIAMSGDGQSIVAVDDSSAIYVSYDSGRTWVQEMNTTLAGGTMAMSAVAIPAATAAADIVPADARTEVAPCPQVSLPGTQSTAPITVVAVDARGNDLWINNNASDGSAQWFRRPITTPGEMYTLLVSSNGTNILLTGKKGITTTTDGGLTVRSHNGHDDAAHVPRCTCT